MACSSCCVERKLFAPQLPLDQSRKPAFHQVQPIGRRGREVEVKATALPQPAADLRRLVSGGVVENQVPTFFGRR